MLKTIGFIMFFEVDNGSRDRNANRDDAARRSQGGRKEVAGRSQGGCKARAVIDFEPLGRSNTKELNLETMCGRQWNMEH